MRHFFFRNLFVEFDGKEKVTLQVKRTRRNFNLTNFPCDSAYKRPQSPFKSPKITLRISITVNLIFPPESIVNVIDKLTHIRNVIKYLSSLLRRRQKKSTWAWHYVRDYMKEKKILWQNMRYIMWMILKRHSSPLGPFPRIIITLKPNNNKY